jgi:ribonuclease T1
VSTVTAKRSWVGLLAAVVIAVLLWWTQGHGETAPDTGTDPGGLPAVALADLPPEASQTLDLIDAGGPYPYDQDDGVFMNREDILPDEADGYYREYTVETPGSDDRGARRIVAGDGGEFYWTDDHYASFARIER